MSRYNDCDDYEGEPDQILAYGRWQNNARRTLKGKRGRKALAELREALLALPEKKLIEGAVCTVGAARRREAHVAEAMRQWEATPDRYRYGDPLDCTPVRELDRLVESEGEGVCAIGALVWHRKVKAGESPAQAFAGLPDFFDHGDGLDQTADLAVGDAGLAYTLAWELAYRNDETYSGKTPEERYAAFLAWIDGELATHG